MLEISKLESCGKVANYYIKEPTPEGEIKIYLCKDHTEGMTNHYLYIFGEIKSCEERI